MYPTHRSISKKLNNEGDAIETTTVNEVGAASHRTAVTVDSTAQEITMTAGKRSIELQNTGDKNIYYGGSGVDSTKGIIIYPTQTKTYSNVKDDASFSLYVVCAALETSTLRIVEYA